MNNRINIFYQFDKGFFGKTLAGSNGNAVKRTKAASEKVFDSVDDFVNHFKMEILRRKTHVEPSLKSDVFQPSEAKFEMPGSEYPFSMIF